MVDQDLMTATDELVGEITSFDVISFVEGAIGLGWGLFSADFAAQLIGGMLQGQRRAVRFLAEIGTKGALTVAYIFGRRFGGELITTILGLAAVGSGVSLVLQIIDAIAETAARIATGELSVGGSTLGSGDTQSDKADVGDEGFGDEISPHDDGGGGAAEMTV